MKYVGEGQVGFTSRFIRIPFVMHAACSATVGSAVKSECNIFHGGT